MWGYIQIITFVCLMLMFIGTANEYVVKEDPVTTEMSEEQVRRVWGEPDRVTTSDSMFPGKFVPTRVCIWTYQDPYRLIVFRDGNVVRCFEK